MQKQSKNMRWKSQILLWLFVGILVFRLTHHLFLHDHAEHSICQDTGKSTAKTHLHDHRYQPDDCSVCAFLFAVPDAVVHVFWMKKSEAIFSKEQNHEESHFCSPDSEGHSGRGPPTFFS